MYFQIDRREDFENFQQKIIIHVWGGRCTNYSYLIISHCIGVSKYHIVPLNMYNYVAIKNNMKNKKSNGTNSPKLKLNPINSFVNYFQCSGNKQYTILHKPSRAYRQSIYLLTF